MADGRMLKKLVSTSRKLADLNSDSARLLWTWILPHADIKGRFSAEPSVIKGYIVPRLKSMTVAKIGKYLLDMAANDMILLYNVNNDSYLEIVKFAEFQTLREGRESESIIPPPGTPGVAPGVPPDNSGVREDKLREGKLREDKTREDKRVYLDFVKLTDEEHRKLEDKFGITLDDKLQALNDYIGSKGAKYKSHYHTILNWERRERKTTTNRQRQDSQPAGSQRCQAPRRDSSEGSSIGGTISASES